MSSEVMADAGAAAENLAPESQNPEVASPETSATETAQQTDATPENGDDADKSLKRLQRRVDRVTAARYQAEARAHQLEAELQRYRQPVREESASPQDPADIDRIATERAREMRQSERIAAQSAEIRSAAIKAAGGEAAFAQAFEAVTEEAGPLADARTGQWTPLGEAIAESDSPGELLVYLGRNPDVAESLHGLTGARLQREVVKIEARMQAQTKPPPKPLKPVTPTGVTASRSQASMTDAEWYNARHGRK
jgi:hypothetical protein